MTQDVYPPPRAPGLMDVVHFTASGTFNKADYPGAQSVRVRCQAAGGAGAGSQTNNTGGAGGSGGGYAESLLDAGSLPSSVPVTVGAGGVGVAGSTGGGGGDSSFGALVSASGGDGGHETAGSPFWGGHPVGEGLVGDLLITGGAGGSQADSALYTSMYIPGQSGGSSHLGGGGLAPAARAANSDGVKGGNYGGGGGGGFSRNATVSGGNGAQGIVIVEVYSTYAGNTGDFLTRSYLEAWDQSTEWFTVNAPNEGGDTDFENGWTNFGYNYQSVQYRKMRDGRVEIHGAMKSGTLDATAFTLPVGFRPDGHLMFPVPAGGGSVTRVEVMSDGTVLPTSASGATNSYFSLSGIVFDPA